MPLITSISGIRGTIGGREGQGLTPADILKFTSAFASTSTFIFTFASSLTEVSFLEKV